MLSVRFLGKLHVSFDGSNVNFKAPPKSLPLFLALVLHRGPQSRQALAQSLWPDDTENDALAKLRRHLYAINQTLPTIGESGWLVGKRETVAWNESAPAWFDVRVFREAVADAKRVGEAVSLYRGDLLEGCYDELVLAERERFRNAYVDVLIRAAHQARAERDYQRAIGYAEALLACDEWNEEGAREWMAAKYESGDRSAALTMYEGFARRLRADFSADPSPETIALRETIRAGGPLDSVGAQPSDDVAVRAWKLPFVGRSRELHALRAAWARAARGTGGLILLSGEAGIGKSRLAATLAGQVQREGGQVLSGWTSHPEAEPYQAVVVALRPTSPALAQTCRDQAWADALSGVLPEICPDTPREDLPPERARQRLFEAFARAIEQLARARPVCLILEDLHWAGPATVDLLAALARRTGTHAVLIVATYRTASASDAAGIERLERLRTALVADRRAIGISLERLAREDVAELTEKTIDGEHAGHVGGIVAARSDGNPLFATHLIEEYLETRSLPDAAAPGGSVVSAIAARLTHLPRDVRSIAEVASAVGETFRVDLVADVGGWSESSVMSAVVELLDRGLAREAGSSQYAFSHALVAAAVYEGSPVASRALRHHRIASVLEREAGADAAGAATIARHWRLAEQADRAATAYLRAARLAFGVSAREDAILFARAALESSADSEERFEAALLVSKAQDGFAAPETWLRDIQTLAQIARTLGPEQRFLALVQEWAYYHQVGDRSGEGETIDAMLAMTQAELTPYHRFTALQAQGAFFEVQVRLSEAVEALTQALSIDASVPPEERLAAGSSLANAYARLARYDDAAQQIAAMRAAVERGTSGAGRIALLQAELGLALTRQHAASGERAAQALLEIAAETGDVDAEISARITLAWIQQGRVKVSLVRAHYDAAMQLAERLDFAFGLGTASVDRGQFEAVFGLYAEALAYFDRALVLLRQSHAQAHVGFCLANRARALLATGDLAAALSNATEAAALAQRLEVPRLTAWTATTLGMILVRSGEHRKGMELMVSAIAKRREIDDQQGLCDALSDYADELRTLGRSSEAAKACGELAPLLDSPAVQPSVQLRACLVIASAGDDAQAALFGKRAHALQQQALDLIDDEPTRRSFLGKLSASADR